MLLAQTRSHIFREIHLSLGPEEKDFISELKVVVYDAYLASTEFKLDVTVI